MKDEVIHIALVQTNLFWEDVDSNLLKFEKLLENIKTETDIIVLPEMFSTGFSMHVKQFAELMDGKAVSWMKSQARRFDLVISGSLMIKEEGCFYNRFIFAKPNGEVEWYDKRHLFSMGDENIHFSPGKERKIFRLKGFRILPQICYDLRFPVFSRNRNDYDLLINSANWPSPRKDVWQTLLKARAIENQAYVAGVNRVGVDANGIRYTGESAIIDPKGKPVIFGETNSEQILHAKLSLSSLQNFRKRFSVLDDRDDFNLI